MMFLSFQLSHGFASLSKKSKVLFSHRMLYDRALLPSQHHFYPAVPHSLLSRYSGPHHCVVHTKYVPFSVTLLCMAHFIQVSAQSHPQEACSQLLYILLYLLTLHCLFIHLWPILTLASAPWGQGLCCCNESQWMNEWMNEQTNTQTMGWGIYFFLILILHDWWYLLGQLCLLSVPLCLHLWNEGRCQDWEWGDFSRAGLLTPSLPHCLGGLLLCLYTRGVGCWAG